MNKKALILKYFQKAHLLTVDNPDYCRTISSLFEWLTENDRIKNDRTTQLLNLDKQITVKIIARQKLIMAGMEEIAYLLKKYTHLSSRLKYKDSQFVDKDQVIAEITGNTSEILAYERTILNILQRMSGIATETKNIMQVIARQENFVCKQLPMIAATRKTPWMTLDKKAVATGGGLTHRLDLSDGILIKDNHLSAIKKQYHLKTGEETIKKALEIMSNRNSKELIEIEVETEKEAFIAVSAFSRNNLAILLDNFMPEKAKQTIEKIKKEFDVSKIIFEASGGINSENIGEWANTGVDFLSLGSLTHSPKAADLSIEI